MSSPAPGANRRPVAPSRIDAFCQAARADASAAAATLGASVDGGPNGPRDFRYRMGTTEEGDARALDVVGWAPRAGWEVQFKERGVQNHRVDDLFIHVPGYGVPFRGIRQLRALGLIDGDAGDGDGGEGGNGDDRALK